MCHCEPDPPGGKVQQSELLLAGGRWSGKICLELVGVMKMQRYYPFPCDCCSECCKHIDKVPALLGFDRGDGVCKFLNNNGRCLIYKIRPNVCNGQYIYEHYFSYMTVRDFHQYIYKLCKQLKEGVYK